MKKTNKTTTIILIILLSILCIILIGFLIAFICGVIPIWSFNVRNYKVSNHLAYEEIYDRDIQSIEVDSTLGDIEILPSNDENIHLSIYSDNRLFEVNDSDSSLVVKFQEEEGFHFQLSRTKDLVRLYVPEDCDILFELASDSGDVEVMDFSNASFDISVDMGEVAIDSCDTLDIESDMGDVRIGTVRELDAVLDLGNLEVTSITESLSIDADMGKVSLDEVHLLSDSTITLSLGDLDIKQLSNAYVDAKTDLGDVDVENNDRNAPYTLTIKNDMGDITIG